MYQRAEKVMRENEVQEGDTINPYNETLNDTGISPTLTTRPEGNKTAILAVVEDWKTIVGNKQMNPFRGSVEEESPCITSACGCGGGMTPMVTNADLETTKTKEFIEQMRGHKQMQYRIRKLTERECFRLMGVKDEDSDKIRSVVSKSQCYKLAGNSIVVDVMVHMFDQLFFGNKNTNQQLELF
jgi:DNA (cytosine-5)-methyltransferase 1